MSGVRGDLARVVDSLQDPLMRWRTLKCTSQIIFLVLRFFLFGKLSLSSRVEVPFQHITRRWSPITRFSA